MVGRGRHVPDDHRRGRLPVDAGRAHDAAARRVRLADGRHRRCRLGQPRPLRTRGAVLRGPHGAPRHPARRRRGARPRQRRVAAADLDDAVVAARAVLGDRRRAGHRGHVDGARGDRHGPLVRRAARPRDRRAHRRRRHRPARLPALPRLARRAPRLAQRGHRHLGRRPGRRPARALEAARPPERPRHHGLRRARGHPGRLVRRGRRATPSASPSTPCATPPAPGCSGCSPAASPSAARRPTASSAPTSSPPPTTTACRRRPRPGCSRSSASSTSSAPSSRAGSPTGSTRGSCSRRTTRCRGGSLFLLPSLFSDSMHVNMLAFVLFYGLDWVATVPPTIALCRSAYGERAPIVFGWVFASHQLGAAAAALGAGLVARPARHLRPGLVRRRRPVPRCRRDVRRDHDRSSVRCVTSAHGLWRGGRHRRHSEAMSDGAATAYQSIYDASLRDPEGFWRTAAEGIDWVTPPTRILDDSRPPFYRWYPDAELNVCFNAVDRHVAAGRGEQAAIHYDSPVTGTKSTMTYAVLLERVRAVAGGLRGLGRRQGRPGRHLHADGPRGRHRHARLRPHRRHPLRGLRRLRAAGARRAHRRRRAEGRAVGVVRRRAEPGRALQAVPRRGHPALGAPARALRRPPARAAGRRARRARPRLGRASSPATPPARAASASRSRRPTRSTSSTRPARRGSPRASTATAGATPWRCGGRWPTSTTSRPGETMFTASDVGWVVGHSYIVYAPLLTGRDDRALRGQAGRHARRRRVLARHRGVRRRLPLHRADRVPRHQEGRLDGVQGRRPRPLALPGPLPRGGAARPRHLRVGLGRARQAGHRQLVADRDRVADRRQPQGDRAAADQAGLADRRRCRATTCRCSTARASRSTPGVEGAICIKLPMPPGTLPTLWGDDDRYVSSYLSAYPGYYLTGDGGYLDEDGYLYVMGRTDDVLNVAGHRLSTGSLEAALAGHEAVAECAVIGVHDDLKGQVPRALVVLKSGVDAEADGDRIRRELVARVRVGGRRGRSPAPGRHRGRAAQDALGQDPAQDDARDGRRQEPGGARRRSRTPRCSTPSRRCCAAPPRDPCPDRERSVRPDRSSRSGRSEYPRVRGREEGEDLVDRVDEVDRLRHRAAARRGPAGPSRRARARSSARGRRARAAAAARRRARSRAGSTAWKTSCTVPAAPSSTTIPAFDRASRPSSRIALEKYLAMTSQKTLGGSWP